jgi:hypothetical protein
VGRRCSGITDSDLRRVEIPVVTDPHRCFEAVRIQERIEAAGLFGRDEFDIKAHAPPALKIGIENVRVLWSTRDLEAPRVHAIERLASFLRKCFDLAAGILDKVISRSLFRAQLTMPAARGEVCDPMSCLPMRAMLSFLC